MTLVFKRGKKRFVRNDIVQSACVLSEMKCLVDATGGVKVQNSYIYQLLLYLYNNASNNSVKGAVCIDEYLENVFCCTNEPKKRLNFGLPLPKCSETK